MYFTFLINDYKWNLINKNTVHLILSTVYRLLAIDLDLLDFNRLQVHFTVLVWILNVEQTLPVHSNKPDDIKQDDSDDSSTYIIQTSCYE